MIYSTPVRLLSAMLIVVAAVAVASSQAAAQSFGPPQTIFGSITDSGGAIQEKLPVEAYIADKVCGRGTTEFVGEGSSRVTVYAIDVVSREQSAGCGSDGAEVRIKVGDRFASQTARWRAGPLQVDLLFGSGATPVPIPTFTPVPPTPIATATSVAAAPTTAGAATATPEGSATAVATEATTPTVLASVTVAATTAPSATPTLTGGLVSSVQGGGGSGDDGGLPVWGIVLAVLAGVAVVGGGVGVVMARSRAAERDTIHP